MGVDLSLKSDQFLDPAYGYSESSYVGLENYRQALNDPRFWKSLANSAYFIGGTVLIVIPLAFILALSLLNFSRGVQGVFLFLLMVPGLTMPSILSTLFYLFFHGKEGALNQYLIIPFGFEPINWMMNPQLIMPCLIMQSVWRWTGIITLFFLSGMESIPRWQTEVARLEGMGLWSRIYQVWYPGTRHLILFAGIFLTVEGIASFSGAYVLLGGSGGILDSGLLFVTYLYQVAFPGGSGRFDFPTAMSMTLLITPIMALILFVCLKVGRIRNSK